MTNQGKWMSEMLAISRNLLDTGLKSMGLFQEQAEKAMDFAIGNTNMMQEESKKAVRMWMENVKKARTMYTDAIEEGFSNLEKQFKGTSEKK